MTPRRKMILRAFAEAYLEAIPPAERIAFLQSQMLSISDLASAADLIFAAVEINDHADALHSAHPIFTSPIPNPGVSP